MSLTTGNRNMAAQTGSTYISGTTIDVMPNNFRCTDWPPDLLHFLPTPYTGKVNKGQRPTLNRILAYSKTELGAEPAQFLNQQKKSVQKKTENQLLQDPLTLNKTVHMNCFGFFIIASAYWRAILIIANLSVGPFVCPLHSSIRWKQLNISSQFFLHHTVAQTNPITVFKVRPVFDAKYLTKG